MLKLAIHGAAGRMGCRLVALSANDDKLNLVAAIDHPEHPRIGDDSGVLAGAEPNSIALTSELVACDAVIDFSLPEAVEKITAQCVEMKIPLVVATTGFEEPTAEKIREAASTIPIVWAPNMSLAVNLTMKLVENAAKVLGNVGADVDIEILERHHRFKADSPSGTALKFGEIIREQIDGLNEVHGRFGQVGERPRQEIGYHAIRVGDDPGQHTIVFGMMGEKVELHVAASNRDCYALGALAAAKFIVGQEPGMYSMFDVLGL